MALILEFKPSPNRPNSSKLWQQEMALLWLSGFSKVEIAAARQITRVTLDRGIKAGRKLLAAEAAARGEDPIVILLEAIRRRELRIAHLTDQALEAENNDEYRNATSYWKLVQDAETDVSRLRQQYTQQIELSGTVDVDFANMSDEDLAKLLTNE